jgi:ribosomal protein L19
MFLDPRKVDVTMKQAVDNAKRAEKEKDIPRARMGYEVAGGLAIYEGNAKKVVEYYGEAARVTGEKYLILNNTDKAVAKAQEYYKQHLLS